MAGCGVGVVPRDALEPRLEKCPVCGDPGARARSLVLQSDPEVVLLRCARCHAESASQLPTDAFLASLYDPSTYASSLVSDPALAARSAASILASVKLDTSQPVEVLDYGGSDGTLSLEMVKQLRAARPGLRVRATVVDLFPRPDTEFQRFITPAAFEAEGTQYHLLVASAVLEHLKDVGRVLRTMAAAAAPGAQFYARTPYDVPLAALPLGYKVKWPRHLHDLGPAFWDHVLESFGLHGEILISRPSIVETSLKQAALRTVAAHVLKFPAHVEADLRGLKPAKRGRLWHYVGGWEVVIRFGA